MQGQTYVETRCYIYFSKTISTALPKLFPYVVFRFIYGQVSGTVPEATFPYTQLQSDAEKTPKYS